MESSYFTPADFSDFEESMETAKVVEARFVPNKEHLSNIRARLDSEFKACESGVSKLSNRAVQASTTVGTKNLMEVMLDNFCDKTVTEFLEMVKQDFGLLVAEWAAQDVLGPFSFKATELAGNWRNRG